MSFTFSRHIGDYYFQIISIGMLLQSQKVGNDLERVQSEQKSCPRNNNGLQPHLQIYIIQMKHTVNRESRSFANGCQKAI